MGTRDFYLRYWMLVLTGFLGWEKAQVESWAQQWWEDMSNEEGAFYHELPNWYIAPLFVPENASARLSGLERRRLNTLIESLLNTTVPVRADGQMAVARSPHDFQRELDRCIRSLCSAELQRK